ncbi:MAG: two-partner secretion domain-containing protein [Nostoc sp.]
MLSLSRWGALFSIAIVSVSTFSWNCANAQITSDGTLPNNSSIQKESNTFNITGGTKSGSNLFHSFGEFSVPTGNTAFFRNAADIQNIISRVTGNSISNIDGLIRANNTANLFLINPNGIIFGQNARLDIGGSFLASTASSLKFADGFEFSAINPQSAPLLSINVPVGLQYGANPGSILNQSQAIDDNGEFVGLEVKPEKTLALVGGDVVIEGGFLVAPSGRIELGSVAGNSFVSLKPNDTGYTLGYEGIENFKDIHLTQEAFVATDGNSGGSIQVQGANVILADGSLISAVTLGEGTEKGLTVNATNSVQVIGESNDSLYRSALWTRSGRSATAAAGDLTINTRKLIVRDGAEVSTRTSGIGQGGKLSINASDSVEVFGTSANEGFYTILGTLALGSGAGGDLTIATKRLVVSDGSQLGTSTFGQGQGGKLTVNASDSVESNHTSGIGVIPTNLFTQSAGSGAAGDLTVTTKRLIVSDGGRLGSGIFGKGQGGELTVNASESVQVIGTSVINGQKRSTLLGNQTKGAGAAGNLMITTQQIMVRDEASIINDSLSTGASGDLAIATRELIVQNGGSITTSSIGTSKSSNLTVTASDFVELKGTGIQRNGSNTIPSGLFTRSFDTGDAGNLSIETKRLFISDGARVSSSTFLGKGGNLTVFAPELVMVIGTSSDKQVNSGLFSQTVGTGDAGNIRIQTGQLILRDQAEVTVSANDLTKESIVDQITASVADLAGKPLGTAGSIEIKARNIFLENQAGFRSTTVSGNGGNITLQVQDLLLMRRGSEISTSAGTAQQGGDGGSININSKFIVGIPEENSNISANAFSGAGGNVQINTQGIFGIESRPKPTENSDITASSELGVTGEVTINSPDTDPSRGLIQLPSNLVDASQQIAQGCTPRGRQNASRFIATGRGGLPQSPNEPLRERAVITGWVDLPEQVTHGVTDKSSTASMTKSSDPIVEAQGWIVDANGHVMLVAQSVQSSSIPSAISCSQ